MAPGDRLVVARGGRGGRGNVHFVSPTHRAPTHYEKGAPGEERWIELELKLIADIGLVGAPNAGKSTLLAALTAARPKVGAFPFTTTSPNLGVLALDEERSAVIADVPGLIEGAHEGQGLGHAFLRHVERTRVLVAVVDGAADDPVAQWRAVEEELRLHDPALLERPMPMAVTKQDLPDVRAQLARRRPGAASGRPTSRLPSPPMTGPGSMRCASALDEALAVALVTRSRSSGRRAGSRSSLRPAGRGLAGRRPRTMRCAFVAAGSRRPPRGSISRTRSHATDSSARWSGWASTPSCAGRAPAPGTLVRIGRVELEWGDDE